MMRRFAKGAAVDPSSEILAGDTAFLRITVLEAGPDYCRIQVQDDVGLMTTIGWAPKSEIAKLKDIDKLRPLQPPPTMWRS